MIKHNYIIPAGAVALCLVISYGIINLFALTTRKELFPVKRGLVYLIDYYDYYAASKKLTSPGHNIYKSYRYVSPPVPAILNYPLSTLSFETARRIISFLILISSFLAVVISGIIFFRKPSGDSLLDKLNYYGMYSAMGIVILFSYPFYFIFERGNTDWLVMLMFWGGMMNLNRDRQILAGISWGMAICLKLYPVLLIIPVIIHRKWKALIGMIAVLVVAVGISPALWIAFFKNRIFLRMNYFRIDENVSLANSIYYMLKLIRIPLSNDMIFLLSNSVYAVLICVLTLILIRRRNTGRIQTDVLYFVPFMFMIPNTVYPYALIFIISLIPFYCYLWLNRTSRSQLIALSAIITGVALTQAQAILLETITGRMFPHFLPGFGLLIIAVATLFLVATVHSENTTAA